MADPLKSFDWALVQTFLAVVDTGSLSDAARQLSMSQPTAGRQIARMEALCGLDLFHRRARGLVLTDAGAALLPHARSMAEGMRGLSLAAAGRSDRLSGPVRVTASVATAHFYLPPILAKLRAEEPEITIDLVASDETENLLYREADIAVRMFRSRQLDIVTRHLGTLETGAFAARSYIARRGRLERYEDLLQHDLVGYDRRDEILRGMRDFGLDAQRDWFATRCDHNVVHWELVRAGCGIGFVQVWVARNDPEVERLVPQVPLPGLPVWLAAHEAVRHTPRICRVWDALAEGLGRLVTPPVVDPPQPPR